LQNRYIIYRIYIDSLFINITPNEALRNQPYNADYNYNLQKENHLIFLQQLQDYYQEDSVFITAHAAERFRQRGIKQKDIKICR